MENPMEENSRSMKVVWSVIERGQANGLTKAYWSRVGVGFVNRDGSLTLRLDAIPLSGSLQVRDWEPYDRRSDAGEASPAPRRNTELGDAVGGRLQRPKPAGTPGESLA
jgi:hypothetical protein